MVSPVDVAELASRLDAVVDHTQFYGVVQVALHGRVLYERATGYSDRAHQVPNTSETEFAIASGTKSPRVPKRTRLALTLATGRQVTFRSSATSPYGPSGTRQRRRRFRHLLRC